MDASSEPLVSVIIPVFNAAAFLGDALRSVEMQSYRGLETIVVDDGSLDGSRVIAETMGAKVLALSHRGVSAARNAGIQAASGDLVAFLDADDRWYPDKIALQLQQITRVPEAVACFGAAVGLDVDTGRTWSLSVCLPQDALRALILRGPIVGPGGSTALVRRSPLLRAGGFDERLSNGEDWDAWIRLAELGPFTAVSTPLAIIRRHRTNASRNVRQMEIDNSKVLESFFSRAGTRSPLARERRRSYGNHYLRSAGSYLDDGKRLESLRCVVRAVLWWPPHLFRVLGTPLRRMTRRASR